MSHILPDPVEGGLCAHFIRPPYVHPNQWASGSRYLLQPLLTLDFLEHGLSIWLRTEDVPEKL